MVVWYHHFRKPPHWTLSRQVSRTAKAVKNVEKGHDSVGSRVGSEICHGKWTAGWKVAGSNELFGLEDEGILLCDLFG